MFDRLDALFANLRGLPDGAQFAFCLAVIFLALALCAIADKVWARWQARMRFNMRVGKPKFSWFRRHRKPTLNRQFFIDHGYRYPQNDCPYGEPLHDHPDGCPACYMEGKHDA